jgi:hypothetical protein
MSETINVRRHAKKGVSLPIFTIFISLLFFASAYGIPLDITVAKSATPSSLSICQEATVNLQVNGVGDPQVTSVPIDVMLVIDRSDSMNSGSRLAAAKDAAKAFVSKMDFSKDRVGLASFEDLATLNQGLTNDSALVINAINNLVAVDFTNLGEGIKKANDELTAHGRSTASQVIIVLTDGVANRYGSTGISCSGSSLVCPGADDTCTNYARSMATTAKDSGRSIFTIGLNINGLCTSNSTNPTPTQGRTFIRGLLQAIASTPAQYYEAPSSSDLNAIYNTISHTISYNISGTNVVVTDVIPAHAQYVSGSLSSAPPASCAYNAGTKTITCNIGTVYTGDSYLISFRLTFNSTGLLTTNVYPDSKVTFTDFSNNPQTKIFTETKVTVAACDNGIYCDGTETCSAGACVAGTQIDCSGLNDACNTGTCSEAAGQCVKTPKPNGTICADTLYCNGIETCQNGTFTPGTPVNCDGNNISGIAACDNNPDAIHYTWDYRIAFTSACNETTDSCTTGDSTITHECSIANCGAKCEDDSDCKCKADECVGPDYYDYPDTTTCSADCTCGTCTATISYNDSRCGECTTNAQCDDQIYCNGQETCDTSYKCQPGTPVSCSSLDDQCNTGICSETNDRCEYSPEEAGTTCEADSSLCTIDQCDASNAGPAVPAVCAKIQNVDCSNLNGPCQSGTCNPSTGQCHPDFTNYPLSTPCEADSSLCTIDHCNGSGTCTKNYDKDCSASADQCNNGACNPATGNCYASPIADNTPCNDSLFCNIGEKCINGQCLGGTAKDCAYNNLDPIGKCNNVPDAINYTWDYFAGFTSACNDALDICTSGTVTLTHTCSILKCGADCETNSDCTCEPDGCIGNDYYNYPANTTCNTTNCTCGTCTPTISYNDERCLDPLTIIASKIVCNTESDLPNWGLGGPDITSTTAQDFVNSHPGCHLESGWLFQWAHSGTANPGDSAGEAGTGWTTFGPTDAGGQAITTIKPLNETDRFWVREEFKAGYIPFTYNSHGQANTDNVSAELYCHQDVVNYDNYDFILNPQLETTYYCITFNALQECQADSDCDKLDADYCGGSKKVHEEGKCVNYECKAEKTETECDNGAYCDGTETCNPATVQCTAGTQIDCSGQNDICNNGTCSEALDKCVKSQKPNGTLCADTLYCNGDETCQSGTCTAGTPINCSGNNLTQIATCDHNPDAIHYTWDYFAGFTSTCNEANDTCTTGTITITHTCNTQTCGAECETNADCTAHLDGNTCYYSGACSLEPQCACNYNNIKCPVPGSIIDGYCYYGERTCNENGCDIDKAPMNCYLECDPVLGPSDLPQIETLKTITGLKAECDYFGDSNEANACWFAAKTTTFALSSDYTAQYGRAVQTYYRQRWKLDYNSAWGAWSAWHPYTAPFSFAEDSIHEIEYYSLDPVCQIEETHNYEMDIIDSLAPMPVKTVGEPKEVCTPDMNCEWHITTTTPVTLDCRDQMPHPSDNTMVCYRYYWDNKLMQDWKCVKAPAIIFFPEECQHRLDFYCKDALENTSETDSELFKVDGTSIKIPLYKKWNLISVPFPLLDSSPGTVFGDIDENIGSVWTYDAIAKKWLVWRPDSPSTSNLAGIQPGWGYWVSYIGEKGLLTLGGALFSPATTPASRPLAQGWNLIGYYGTDWQEYEPSALCGLEGPCYGQNAYCSLGSLVESQSRFPNWNSLVSYLNHGNHNTEWAYLNVCGDIDMMHVGRGYWISMNAPMLYAPSTVCIWNKNWTCGGT